MDAVHVHMSNTMNTPVEVLETAYPLRVDRYELRPDSGGAGRFRGGVGLRRDITVRDHTATFSLLADRQRHPPYGLAGGEDGEPGAAYRIDADEGGSATDADPTAVTESGTDADPTDGAATRLAAKSTHDLPSGTIISLRTPGAGGYGPPDERDPAALAEDLRRGTVTEAAARAAYGDDLVDAALDRPASDG
jgi:N-methylhydantoinase B